MRWSSSRRLRQVSLVWFSAILISSSASQQSSTWARIRSSLRWWTGRRSSVVFMSRQARSISALLVAERDVLGGERRVGGSEQELAVQVLLGIDGGAVDPQLAGLGLAQEALVAALGRQLPVEFGGLRPSARPIR